MPDAVTVDPTGKAEDSHPTLAEALDKVAPGGTITVLAGLLTECVAWTRARTAPELPPAG
jgi:hypothetical protein